ncbi:MAG: discoidin domain-containing protein [Acidobacteriota bacterium]|nr:discoidin domain-containing protein [Acidobacteriota bacterium]
MLSAAWRQVFAILFGSAFTVATCYSAGRILLARLQVKLYSEETWLFAFVAGSAALSLAVFALAALGAVYPAVLFGLGAALIFFATRHKLPGQASLPALPAFWKWTFALVFTAYTVLYWSHAMGPEYSPDGSTYHLGYVARYLRQHGFGRITTSIYANLSQGLEMLFLFAFAFGRHSAAAMVHFAFFVALTLGIVTYARRFGFPAAGVFAATLVYASPIFGWDGTTAYNDVAAACVVFFVFYVLQIWAAERDARNDRLLLLVGLLSGFAYAIKYTAAVILIYAIGFVLWKSRSVRRAAVVGGVSAILIAPWMIKNWIVVANPVSPLMNRFFPNPYVSLAFEHEWVRNMTHVDGYTPIARFLDTTFRAGQAGSILGVAFLLAPIALLALWSRPGRNLLTAGIVVGLVCGINVKTRFLLPAVPFIALAMGIGLMRIPAAIPAMILMQAILCWPTVVKKYSDGGLRVRHFLPLQALRIESEDSTLSYRLPGYRISRMVEQLVPPNGRVFSFASPPEAYTSRELLIYYEATPTLAAMDILSLPSMPDRQPGWQLSFAIHPQPLRAIRIVSTNADAAEQWRVAEIHIGMGGAELVRSPQWKIVAQPNPFEIGDAFDGKPVTRWCSRQTVYKGMLIGVDFGKDESIDRVSLDGSHDQYGMALRLEGQDSSGAWKTLATEPQRSKIPVASDLRHAATIELKQRGITHLLIDPTFPGAADMTGNPKAWGLRFLGEAEHTRLYAIE